MAVPRPLHANSTLHPEYFAAPADAADRVGRFHLCINGAANRDAETWHRYSVPTRASGEGGMTDAAFDPAFRIVLRAARECRLFGVSKSALQEPDAPREW